MLAVKERPITFSAETVRAILDGRKTQIRRVIKPQPYHDENMYHEEGWIWDGLHHQSESDLKQLILMSGKCPYGQVGDRLWVREMWRASQFFDDFKPSEIWLNENVQFKDGFLYTKRPDAQDFISGKWRSPRFMPRWASRITLEITDIRVERLQEIPFNDLKKEGIDTSLPDKGADDEYWRLPGNRILAYGEVRFKDLWNSINGKRGYTWESSPWVWVISFKKEK